MLYLCTKNVNHCIEIYRSVSLLAICNEVFDYLLSDTIFLHLLSNNLVSENQLDFRPDYSCINQLLGLIGIMK